MNTLAARFMKAAVIYGLIGFAAGTYMGATENFTMRSAHSHLNLVGWVTLAVCAAYYQMVPAAAETKIAAAHFWLANVGLIVMIAGLVMLYNGNPGGAPAAGIGSIITLVSFILFAVVVFSTPRSIHEKR